MRSALVLGLASTLLALAACSDDATSGSGASGTGGSGASTGQGNGTSSGANGSGAGVPIGGSPSVGDCPIFPADNPWNQDISGLQVHPNSDAFIDSIGRGTGMHADFGTVYQGEPIGIPYNVVPGSQPKVPITFDVPEESEPGPYPIPPDALIEGGPDASGDRHVLVIDSDNCLLYEMGVAYPENGGASWTAYSGAIFDLSSNALRPDTWTSADAAGLPIYPGLVKYEEVMEVGEIKHAIRFTVSSSQAGYIDPARHYASSDTNPDLAPMGLRLRMKASYDCTAFTQEVQVLCAAFKKYGLIVADNGSDWYVSGVPDSRWSDENLADVANITGNAFEAVYTGDVKTY